MEKFLDLSFVIMVLGLLATGVSIITEVSKGIGFLNKIPTSLQVIILSLVLTPVTLLALAAYYNLVMEWYMVFASFIAAFVVAFVSMYGWEKLYDIYNRLKK